MQPVNRKNKKTHPHLYRILIPVLLALLIAALGLWQHLRAGRPIVVEREPDTSGFLRQAASEEISGLSVRLRDGGSWEAEQLEDGRLRVAANEEDEAFVTGSNLARRILSAVTAVGYSAVLSEDPAAFAEQLPDFGLFPPAADITVKYTDGTELRFLLGSRVRLAEDSFYYMMEPDGSRLLAMDTLTAEDLLTERRLLHEITQPVIHMARIDHITLQKPDALLEWQLNGAITDGDAADRWLLLSPVRYPADGEAVEKLRKTLADFRLGAYVSSATEEKRAEYGFDSPRMVITLHMAAGSILEADMSGAAAAVPYPEQTVTLAVGGAKNELLNYILFDGSIYTSSHFILQAVLECDPLRTVTRYPVLTSLSNLRRLTIRGDGEADRVYEVTRTEQLDEDGQPVTDAGGQTVLAPSVTLNGEALPWDAFETAYGQLLLVTVSGILPEEFTAEAEPHTVYTFETVSDTQHTIALAPFDAMHDTVIVDGCALFYLIRDGLQFRPESLS